MNVELLTSPASIEDMECFAAIGALTCRGNADKEFVPSEVLSRIIKAGHESILEHINLTYSIKGISRALLQEVSRHRHISLSVESTRHTLKRQVMSSGYDWVDNECAKNDWLAMEIRTLRRIIKLHPDWDNDELKYHIPEWWLTNLVLTSNVRELRHILNFEDSSSSVEGVSGASAGNV